MIDLIFGSLEIKIRCSEEMKKIWANAMDFLTSISQKSAECTHAIDNHSLVPMQVEFFLLHNLKIIWIHDRNRQAIRLVIWDHLLRLLAEKISPHGINSRKFSIFIHRQIFGNGLSTHGFHRNRNNVNKLTTIIHIQIHIYMVNSIMADEFGSE